jgi:hypothetical protein
VHGVRASARCSHMLARVDERAECGLHGICAAEMLPQVTFEQDCVSIVTPQPSVAMRLDSPAEIHFGNFFERLRS